MICFIIKYREIVPSVFLTRIKLKNFNFIQQHIQLNILLFQKKSRFLSFQQEIPPKWLTNLFEYIHKKSRIANGHNSAFIAVIYSNQNSLPLINKQQMLI